MIDQFFSYEDEYYSRLNIAYDEATRNIPQEMKILEIDDIIYNLLKSMKRTINKEIFQLQIKLLSIALHKEQRQYLHISFVDTLNQLEIDEITILNNIHNNNYEFVATYDYENGKGFFNFQYQRFDYPKDQLLKPAFFDFYIHHLQDVLKIIRWPIYKQEPLRDGDRQTGELQLSRLVETSYGILFSKCLFDKL